MNIGFISTWFERGAAHVTKQYINSVKDSNNIFVYARGGESYAIGNPEWDKDYVTWGTHLGTVDEISWSDIKNWIKKNKLDILFFNEQRNIDILINIKIKFPNIKIGSYIDYYKQNTVKDFEIYDFLICNTKRHYSVFDWHPQCYYVKWGTDTDLYKNELITIEDKVRFFHSAGMSTRKGTSVLIDEYIESDLKKNSKLIIHTQLPIKAFTKYSNSELKRNNIEVIEKTVSAPGLYHLGDVYVYPTELEGLGLTLYEALSCGLPVITTNNGPMNEVINNDIGRLVDVKKQISRADSYYWPLSVIDGKSLYNSMNYYIENKDRLNEYKILARKEAVSKYNWKNNQQEINNIFNESKILNSFTMIDLKMIKKKIYRKKIYDLVKAFNKIINVKLINKTVFILITKMKKNL